MRAALQRPAVALVVLAVGSVGVGCGQRPSRSQPAAAPAKRQALAQQRDPIGARGRTLGLARVVIPPGTSLPLHRHEGTQAAYVQQGALTYSVLAGDVEVMRGASDAGPAPVRRIGRGQTATITAGEWIVEEPDDVHRAANRGRRPVVVLLATLLRTGAPPATPVAGPAGR
ncbi:MAG: cupin domain-containing protein [Solirubrobacteraceae bacterium]|jgi:quercetin dioxygenase-like cupin family protein